MSVVANVLCEHKSWVAYDGRATRDGKIVSENVEKVIMINNFVCVGCTGILEFAQDAIRNFKRNFSGIKDMASDIIADNIKSLLPTINAPPDVYSNFLVTGINRDGQMASYTFGRNASICSYIPHEHEIKIVVLCSKENTIDLTPYIDNCNRKFGINNRSVSNTLHEYVRDVAKIDKSVNSHCQILQLQKPHFRTRAMCQP